MFVSYHVDAGNQTLQEQQVLLTAEPSYHEKVSPIEWLQIIEIVLSKFWRLKVGKSWYSLSHVLSGVIGKTHFLPFPK